MNGTTLVSEHGDMPMAKADDAPLVRFQIEVGCLATLQAGADEVESDLAISCANVLADASGFNLFAS